jgi:hypothetical protein
MEGHDWGKGSSLLADLTVPDTTALPPSAGCRALRLAVALGREARATP